MRPVIREVHPVGVLMPELCQANPSAIGERFRPGEFVQEIGEFRDTCFASATRPAETKGKALGSMSVGEVPFSYGLVPRFSISTARVAQLDRELLEKNDCFCYRLSGHCTQL